VNPFNRPAAGSSEGVEKRSRLLQWVKMRKAHREHMSSGFPSTTDIATGFARAAGCCSLPKSIRSRGRFSVHDCVRRGPCRAMKSSPTSEADQGTRTVLPTQRHRRRHCVPRRPCFVASPFRVEADTRRLSTCHCDHRLNLRRCLVSILRPRPVVRQRGHHQDADNADHDLHPDSAGNLDQHEMCSKG
jgi:hypothetical protein